MKKIKIIIPYFGKFPEFFPYFLMTAKWNSKIDFLIITDQELSGLQAFNINNIAFQKTTFDELKERIQQKFDFEISLDTAYKLCDFKPLMVIYFQMNVMGMIIGDFVTQIFY